jgi:hypothetical protein
LPAMTISARAATFGAAAKGGAVVKGAGLTGLLGALLTPLLALFGMWKTYCSEHKGARSAGEREFYKSYYRRLTGWMVGTILIIGVLMNGGGSLIKTNPALFACLITALIAGYALALAGFFIWRYRVRNKFREDHALTEDAASLTRPGWEYRSRLHLLGLPFIHVRLGGWPSAGPMKVRKPVKAWIAVTDGFAFGLLFAYGGVAVAPVSMGACAIGLFSYGAMAVGAMAVGGFGFGVWAFAGFGFGWRVSAGCAIAWDIASGGHYAIAHHFALGPMAHAAQANNEFVRNLVQTNPFFRTCWIILPYFYWLMWVWAIPLMISMLATVHFKPRRKAAACV